LRYRSAIRHDPWRRLAGQTEPQHLKQQRLIRLGFGITRQNDGATVRRRQVNVDHLYRCHLVQDRARRQSRCLRSQPLLQRHLQAVSQERDQDVRFDPRIGLVVDRPDRQIMLQFFEPCSTSVSCR
jgi:hypothetical protein